MGYILIVWVTSSVFHQAAVSSIGGFNTQQACIAAGKAVVKEDSTFQFVCVSQK